MDVSKKTMLDKLNSAFPYNLFFNIIPEVEETLQDNSINFSDLLCPSLGELKCVLQIGADVSMIEQYEKNLRNKPVTILHFVGWPPNFVEKKVKNFDFHRISKEGEYAIDKTHMGIYVYEDNTLRVIISTAARWGTCNDGIWVSPPCPRLLYKSSSGESPTNFKSSLSDYLKHYNMPSVLNRWIDYVEQADFSDVRVFLVTSVTGSYQKYAKTHVQQMEDLLSKHCNLSPEQQSWLIIAQTSYLGGLGDSPDEWLNPILLKNLAKPGDSSNTELKIIFPSDGDVRNSIFQSQSGLGSSRRYDSGEEKWIHSYLHRWKADGLGRTKIMPHIRTYCRVSPCWKKMAWFLLTTANLSKAGWGEINKNSKKMCVKNCEIGVLFLPQFFDQEYFNIGNDSDDEKKVFPIMYDLPLTKYEENDHPVN